MTDSVTGETKFCSSCEEELPLTDFHRDKTHSDGYKSNCKNCRSGKPAERYATPAAEYAGKTAKELETLARSKAIKRVLDNHWEEFEVLISRYRKEVGLKPTWHALD